MPGNDSDNKWMRRMYSEEFNADSLFECLRQVYLVTPDVPRGSYVDLMQTPDMKYLNTHVNLLPHLDASTTYAPSGTYRRSLSIASDNSYRSLNPADLLPYTFLDSQRFVAINASAIVSGAIAASTIYPKDMTSRWFTAGQGFCAGLLSCGSRSLLHATPLLGDAASLGILALIERSRLTSLTQSNAITSTQHIRLLRSSVSGGLGAILASRAALAACSNVSDTGVKLASSIAASMVGSYLFRRFVDIIP